MSYRTNTPPTKAKAKDKVRVICENSILLGHEGVVTRVSENTGITVVFVGGVMSEFQKEDLAIVERPTKWSGEESLKPTKVHWRDAEEARLIERKYEYNVDERINKSNGLLNAGEWYLYPWKYGTWVSVSGDLYRGNGGKDREEWVNEKKGPWLLLDDENVNWFIDRNSEDAAPYKSELAKLKNKLRNVLGEDD